MKHQTLTFDEHGYLTPQEGIETDIDTLKAYFVDAFPNSERRQWLFDNYLRYTYRFEDDVFPRFEQWINGSFVTQKENPKDIDIVTFVDYWVYEKRGDKVMDKFWTFSLEKERIDAYIVYVYPKEHELHQKYQSELNRWKERYSNTKSVNGISYPKGFLKILFQND